MPRREQLLEMLQSDPDDPFLHYALALDDLSRGDDDAGLDRLSHLNSAHPDYVPAYFQRGQVLARLGDYGTSKTVLQRGIQAANLQGDQHAAAEMTGLLESLPASR
ncbi:MAG: tetratricopeptide repeat protein [Planctomycetaceae bacterium]